MAVDSAESRTPFLFSAYLLLSSRYLLRRRLRTLLVIASIALGVATLVATRALSQGIGKAAQGAVTPWSSVTDLIVLNGQVGLPYSLVERIRQGGISEIREIQPLVIGRAAIVELENRSVLVLGVDTSATSGPESERWGIRVTWEDPSAGLWALAFGKRKAALLGKELASALGPNGRDFTARVAGVELALRSLGSVEVMGSAAPLGNNVVFLQVADAGALVFPSRPDHVSQISITLNPGADAEKARQRVQELIGERGEARTAAANDQSVRDVMAGLELGFAIGGTGALVVGLFLVYNALSVSVAERRHDIGIMRSLGATRRQVAGLFVAEAAVLGVVGAALGVPIGLGLAQAGLGRMGGLLTDLFVQMEPGNVEVSTLALLAAMAAGVATSLLAALVPALQASWEEPADAVRRVPTRTSLRGRLLHLAAIGLLLLVGSGCVLGRAQLPVRYGAFGGIFFLLLASLAATPLIALVLGRLLRPVFRMVLGLEGRLAADNLTRSPGRTGLVIGALAATVGLVVQTAGFITSTERAVFSWLDDQVEADLFVTSGGVASSSGMALPMEEGLQGKLKALPGVAYALPVRFHRLDFRERIVILVAVDTQAFVGEGRVHALARNLERFPRLVERGTVLVSENFAALFKVKPGDRLRLQALKGPVEVEVLGTVVDYTWNRGTILIDRGWFKEAFGDHQVDVFDLFLKPGADVETVRNTVLESFSREEPIFALTREELRRDVTGILNRLYALAYAQQVVVGLVALIGVVGALLISVLQRQRELGLLRAVGATQMQVLRSVLAEAVLMGLIGAVIGMGVGILLEWYTVQVLLPDEAGFIFPVMVPWKTAGVVMGLALLLVTLAGLGPSLHAMRMRIVDAIAYE